MQRDETEPSATTSPSPTRVILLATGAIALLGAISLVLIQRPDPPAAQARPSTSPAPTSVNEVAADTARRHPSPITPEHRTPTDSRNASVNAPRDGQDSALTPPANDPVTIPLDTPMGMYKSRLWEDIAANPPELLEPGDPLVDAEMAYRLYTYYGNCSMSPRTTRQIERQLGHMEQRVEQANGRWLDRLEHGLDRVVSLYELCSAIPTDVDTRMAAVTWMTEALKLGHEIAEVQYYDKIMGFLTRANPQFNRPPLSVQYPELVLQYQDTARMGLERALRRGHPEAYLAKSRAVLEGIIYPRDPQLAFAYARAAELQAAKHHFTSNQFEQSKNTAAQYLDQEQIAEAEHMALELWGDDP